LKRKKGEGDLLHSLLTEELFYSKHKFEAIMKLVQTYAVLLTTNAEIERGSSCMKRIKTAFRNKLSVGRLQGILMISMN